MKKLFCRPRPCRRYRLGGRGYLPGALYLRGGGREIIVQSQSSAEARRLVMDMFPA